MVKSRLTGPLFLVCFFLLIAGPDRATAGVILAKTSETASLCARNLQKIESDFGLPNGLLKAISLAETGWWDGKKGASFAWPWTVTSGRWSQHFQTKNEAIKAVKRLRSRKIGNIDVGCMQVNLGYHPQAFTSLEEAFDPASNIRYAASFLKRLYGRNKSWTIAVGAYHSSNAERGLRYRQKVHSLWRKVRVAAAKQRRRAAIRAYRERAAERNRLRKQRKTES